MTFKLNRKGGEHTMGCFWKGRRLRPQWARELDRVDEQVEKLADKASWKT